MEFQLTIKCDTRDMPDIVLAAKKAIERNADIRKHKAEDIVPEVMCPKCNWAGMVKDLRVNVDIDTTCPKCNAAISRDNLGIGVEDLLQLKTSEMEKYINIICDGQEYDIGVFTTRNNIGCDLCGGDAKYSHTKLIGTTDSREPNFCFEHYREINRDSRFIKKGV